MTEDMPDNMQIMSREEHERLTLGDKTPKGMQETAIRLAIADLIDALRAADDALAYLQACRRTGRANESEDLGQLAEKTRGIIANSLARIEQATSR